MTYSACCFRVYPKFVCSATRARARFIAHSRSSSEICIKSIFAPEQYAEEQESTFSISAGAVVVAEPLLTQTLFFVMGTRQWTRLAGELCIGKVACPMWAFIAARLAYGDTQTSSPAKRDFCCTKPVYSSLKACRIASMPHTEICSSRRVVRKSVKLYFKSLSYNTCASFMMLFLFSSVCRGMNFLCVVKVP